MKNLCLTLILNLKIITIQQRQVKSSFWNRDIIIHDEIQTQITHDFKNIRLTTEVKKLDRIIN
ncbi:MAG: hypothetical protein QNJ68_11185 [Microcoleaceae cyanobacterium MO_207.B10]|nr:hypothetical protein [Microcoleaceae cyanobacterium MO_207.B10]